MTWNCHADDSAKGRYDIMLGIYLLKTLGLNLKLSDHVIEAYGITFKESMAPMVDLVKYEFKDLNTGNITPEE